MPNICLQATIVLAMLEALCVPETRTNTMLIQQWISDYLDNIVDVVDSGDIAGQAYCWLVRTASVVCFSRSHLKVILTIRKYNIISKLSWPSDSGMGIITTIHNLIRYCSQWNTFVHHRSQMMTHILLGHHSLNADPSLGHIYLLLNPVIDISELFHLLIHDWCRTHTQWAHEKNYSALKNNNIS